MVVVTDMDIIHRGTGRIVISTHGTAPGIAMALTIHGTARRGMDLVILTMDTGMEVMAMVTVDTDTVTNRTIIATIIILTIPTTIITLIRTEVQILTTAIAR